MHEYGLLTTLAAALAAALVLGLVTQRIGISPIPGYLLAGVALGPHTPGFVADQAGASQLAEIGVVLLMFGVGLHFHLKDLLAARALALPGALVQSTVATALGALLAAACGWPLSAGLVFGAGISVASTVVLMRVLADSGRLDSPEGHVAVGWLVVEDVLTVLLLVALPALAVPGAGAGPLTKSLLLAFVKVGLLGGILLYVGPRVLPWLLGQVGRTRSRELFTLTVMVLALSLATAAAYAFGVSLALGAFLSGMVVGRSSVSHQAAADALPLRNAFAVLFFVSAGLSFEPRFVLDHPGLTAGTLAIVLVGKPLTALAVVLARGGTFRTAWIAAVGLAQIGEFSFILAEAGVRLGLLPGAARSAIVAAAIVSIAINPVLFRTVVPLESWLRRRPRLWRALNRGAESRGGAINAETRVHTVDPGVVAAVIVGYGPVGQAVAAALRTLNRTVVIVDLNLETVSALRAEGHRAVYGDAGREEVLRAAGVDHARTLVVTIPELADRIPILIAARSLNPTIAAFSRARYLGEESFLKEVGATEVSFEEAEVAGALSALVVKALGSPPAPAA